MKTNYLLSSLLLLIPILVFTGCGSDVQGIDGNGTIEVEEVKLSSQTGGELKQTQVEEGDKVTAGKLLAQIDDSTLKLQLEQAQSKSEQAKAHLELLELGAHPKDIEKAEANLEQARDQFALAEKEWERAQSLYSSGNISQQRYDTAEANYKTTRSGYKAAQAALERLRQPARPQEITNAEESLKQARLQAEILKQRIEHCRIISPISGVVSEIYYKEGEFIPAGRPVISVRNPKEASVTVYVPEPELARLSIGENAEVFVDGHSESFSGNISHINEEAEFTPKNIQTRESRVKLVYAITIDVNNTKGILKPGMPADVRLVDGPAGEK